MITVCRCRDRIALNMRPNNVDGWDPLCRFYSLPYVADLLVRTLSDGDISSIVDLGAGSGTLSDAAIRRWKEIAVTTIDIDVDCEVANRNDVGSKNRTHYTLDALDPDLVVKVSRAGAFDAAICNPPFRHIEWQDGYDRVLSDAGLQQCLSIGVSNVTAEALFLAQNVRLVRPGGDIGLVVSDNFISGRTAASLRKAIVENHAVRAVIQLPKRAFVKTEANSFLLVLRNKVSSSDKINLHKFSLADGLSTPIEIDQHQAERRLDYDFHFIRKHDEGSGTLGSLGAEIKRGTFSTVEVKRSSHFVFHTSDFSKWESGQILGPQVLEIPQCTRPGDILVARVDRALETKIGVVRVGSFPVSDCVFIIRVPAQDVDRVFYALCSETGRQKLRAVSRGVGARHLTKSELLALPLL